MLTSKPVSMGTKPASPTTPQLQRQRGDMIMQRMNQAKQAIGRPAPRPGMGAPVQGPGGMPRGARAGIGMGDVMRADGGTAANGWQSQTGPGIRSFPAPPQGGMRPGAEPSMDDMMARRTPQGGGLPPRLQEAVQAGRLSPEQAGERFAQFQAGTLPGQQGGMAQMQGAPDMPSGGAVAPDQAPGMAPPMGGGQMPSQGAGAANSGMPGGGSPQPRPFNIQSLADLYQMAQGGGMGNPQAINLAGRPNPVGGVMPRQGAPMMGGINPYSR